MEQICHSALKSIFGHGCQLLAFDQIADKPMNSTYKLLCGGHPEPLFFKVEKPCTLPNLLKGQIKREVAGLALCAEHGLPAPAVLGSDTDCSSPWILEEYLGGKPLSDYQLSAENQRVISGEYESLYTTLSGIEGSAYGDTFSGGVIGQFATWKEAIARTTSLLFDDLRGSSELEDCEALAAAALSKAIDNITSNAKSVLFHQDLLPGNLFAREGQDGLVHIGYVIDFGMSSFASIVYSQYITRKYLKFLAPIDISSIYGVSAAELAAYELLNIEPTVMMNYFKFDGYERFTKAFIDQCKKYLCD